MRTGIIDCGTNTFNILVADIDDGQWIHQYSGKLNVRLGKGGFSRGVITSERLARGIDALCSHRETFMNYRVEQVMVFATAAVREAENASEFIKLARDKAGFEVTVIDGNKEAEFIFDGVKQTVDIGEETNLVMDIGGGSTEFIIANHAGVLWKQSFTIGVSKLYEFIQPSDPLAAEEIEKLKTNLDQILSPLLEAVRSHKPKRLIGASGSFDTLVDIISREGSQPSKPRSNRIELDDFERTHQRMLSTSYEERLEIPGMLPYRADTMPLATSLIAYVIEKCQIGELYQSAFALKEGALNQIIDGKLVPQKFSPDVNESLQGT